jgi:2-oxoglutarate dehydrogenase E2 component (dihydrolipoamide succinyltransferase)
MQIEIKIPSVGESVKEAVLVQWYKNGGDRVQKEVEGVLKITVAEGETVAIGSVVGSLETKAAHAPATEKKSAPEKEAPSLRVASAPVEKLAPEPKPESKATEESRTILSPAVRRLVAEKNIDIAAVSASGPGGRITKGDVLLFLERGSTGSAPSRIPSETQLQPKASLSSPESKTALSEPAPAKLFSEAGGISRKPMTPIRQRIAARLLEAKQNTAMLTTFNEIDMSGVMAVRSEHKESFKKEHGVSLGFMSFFIKATVEALKNFPEINASIEAQDIIYHHYYHIGVAIGTERGLIVPVIRDADQLSCAELEQRIVDFVNKIKENRLDLADLEGGTFTISNGGVYGSLLSTPILNMPQSGILGMHKIENRPVAINDKVVIHPMMYVALSYDHRIVDGREAVTFLKRIKECIEKPEEIMTEI